MLEHLTQEELLECEQYFNSLIDSLSSKRTPQKIREKLWYEHCERQAVLSHFLDGRYVGKGLYQCECVMKRTHIITDKYTHAEVHQAFCSECPYEEQRGLKRCFGIITPMDLKKYWAEEKLPDGVLLTGGINNVVHAYINQETAVNENQSEHDAEKFIHKSSKHGKCKLKLKVV
jgi:hypothetical protein